MPLLDSLYSIYKKHTASVAQKKAKRAAAERVYERYLSEGLLLDLTDEILECKRMLIEHIESDHHTSKRKKEMLPADEGEMVFPVTSVEQPVNREEQLRRMYYAKCGLKT